jgi:hypothetical protein
MNTDIETKTTDFDEITAAMLFAAGGESSQYEEGFAPGSRLYKKLPAAQYHEDRDALSCSMLKPLLISPAHFQSSLVAPPCSSKAMDFGTLVHALVLEPYKFNEDFAIYPGQADGRDKDYKAFLAQNTNRLVVDEPTFHKGRTLAEKVLHRSVRGRRFGDFVVEGVPEATIYAQEPTTGLMLRVRIDLYHPECTFDLKSTRHGVARNFLRDAIDMHYDLQAFMYTFVRSLYEGRQAPAPFAIIACETSEPYSIHQVNAGGTFMENGAAKFKEVMSVYAACSQNNYWPDASCDLDAEIEPWQAFNTQAPWKESLGKPSLLN